MAKQLFRPFAADSYSGGGSFFNDGLYNIESARWVLYDFNGKAPGKDGKGLPCLSLKMQPVDKDGKATGADAVMQYWSIGTEEAEIEDKGKALVMTGQYETIWNLSDMGAFYTHLAKSKFDMQVVEDSNDISALEGNVFEFVKVPSPRQQQKASDDEQGSKKRGPAQVIVPATHIKLGGGGGKGGAKGKATPAAKSGDVDHEGLLAEYLMDKVMIEKNAGGVEKLQARMALNKWLQQEKKADADTIKAVAALFVNDAKLSAILEAGGWELSGSTIKLA